MKKKCKETYTVVSGDTCAKIASKHSISKAKLAKYTKQINTDFNCDEIKAGDVICLEPKNIVSKRDVNEPKESAHRKITAKKVPKKTTIRHKKVPKKTTLRHHKNRN
ncbi:hypothetical protein G6F56_013831 [Rhizopus delemar]|nr:hypothetical protein G6F56_013831 [Rhizopus delemar]